ncbi:DUF6555 family protein [Pseudomonas sp. KNUC1026]|uniref:DUF6555 family protein n=1 Tax=Pseudomonas sp. KNUC1026 TaxID=2893890 RepID=UPI002E308E5F|nr:DUF6555 family protein [Pseudomonas sp. KNUC1026]
MARLRHFLIQYRYKGESRSFAQKDSRMSATDAWYYASLHSGANRLYGISLNQHSPQAMRMQAQQCGVTEVGFHELPS